MPSFAGETAAWAGSCLAQGMKQLSSPAVSFLPSVLCTAWSRRSLFHPRKAAATTQQPPSPFLHLADSGQLELQVLDGGILGIKHILQKDTRHQAVAAQPQQHGGRAAAGSGVAEHTEELLRGG